MALMPSESSESVPVQVEFTPEFKRNLRALSKKYRHIRSDVQPVIDQLQAGEVMGDQVPGTHYTIFKVRIRNSDIQKGKRSGYRLIYHVKTSKNIILVIIYSKLNQADISAEQIRHTLIGFDRYNA
jgi:mRNA-degrading endonuclease RelE of RelBE toxin-antitoxin system